MPDVLAAAEAGEEPAASVIDESSRALAEAVLAVVSVCDPRIVLLGGDVGSQPVILAGVRGWVQRLSSRPIVVDAPALGPRAALIGATGLALRMAHESLFSAPRSPALALPDGRGGDPALAPTEKQRSMPDATLLDLLSRRRDGLGRTLDAAARGSRQGHRQPCAADRSPGVWAAARPARGRAAGGRSRAEQVVAMITGVSK